MMTTRDRSNLMRRVGRENTGPELVVRRYLHARGFRYRLHVRSLPGSPDIVLPGCRSVVMVHGCFWHGHHCRHGRVVAKTNTSFWQDKIDANRRRDAAKEAALMALGWAVFTVWECECGDGRALPRLCAALTRRRAGSDDQG